MTLRFSTGFSCQLTPSLEVGLFLEAQKVEQRHTTFEAALLRLYL